MGIDLSCGDIIVSCSYSTWNDIRFAIANACLKWFIDETKDVNPSETQIEMRHHYHLLELVGSLQNQKPESIVDYLSATENPETIDVLIFFGAIGLYKLICKSDCEGFYSPGDSLDISNMLDNIEWYMTDEFNMENIKTLFKESAKLNQNVVIS
jgi:hypothetical protein